MVDIGRLECRVDNGHKPKHKHFHGFPVSTFELIGLAAKEDSGLSGEHEGHGDRAGPKTL